MELKDLIEYLEETECEGTTYFENPSFVDAIVGITDNDQLVYSYEKMIESAMNECGWDFEESKDWVESSVNMTVPEMGDKKPIIIYDLPI